MKLQSILGFFFVLLAVGLLIGYRTLQEKNAEKLPHIQVRGFVGGEKMNLVANPKILKILEERFEITLQPEKRGSVEMVTTESVEGIDFLWPGSQVNLDMYRKSGRPMKGAEILFNSPIVIYSWKPVVEALIALQIAVKEEETYYISKMPEMIQLVTENKKWKAIGVNDLFGSVKVATTNPAKSNSGNQFLCLMGTVMVGNETIELSDIPKIAPTLKIFLKNLGYMHSSSSDLFNQYIKLGMGAYPLVAGYENQIIEFSIQNRASIVAIESQLRLLYPKPTVWSSHPMIAMNEKGKRLIQAFQDPEIQKIAWKEHGFRTASAALVNETDKLDVKGIPSTISSIVSMPPFEVVETLIQQTEP